MRSPRRLAIRLLKIALFAVLGCEVFYLVVMNVFLSTPLFEKLIDATPMIVDIHYERGWSIFPTRIHAKGLSIRATDAHVEWILRFDDITFDCSLLALARQQFHVTRARGEGISFRARMKVASPEALPDKVARLPSIDDLGQVEFIPSEYPYPGEWDDSKWHLWTVQIDDAIAEHVHEVWIDSGRFEGDARIAGSFLLKPMRAARVGPAHVEIRSGRAELSYLTVAEPLTAKIDLELSQFDPRTLSGSDIFQHLTLSVDAATVVPNLDNLALSLPDAGQLRGRVEIPRLALRIDKGVLRDGTSIEAHSSDALVTTASRAISGGLDLTGSVAHDRLSVGATLRDIDADFSATIPGATLTVDSAALDLQNPFTDLHGILDLPAAEVPRAERLAADLWKKPPIHVHGGRLQASLHAEAWRAEERVRAKVGLEGKGLDLVASDVRVRGNLSAKASVEQNGKRGTASFDARAPALELERAARHLALALTAHARAHAADWQSGVLALDEAGITASHLAFSGATTPDALTVDHLSITVESPKLIARDPLTRLELVAAIDGGHLRTPVSLGDLLPSAPGSIALASKAGATFDADVAAQVTNHVARGAASINLKGVGLTAKKLRIAGDARAVANVARWDLVNQVVNGDISLSAANVSGGFDPTREVTDFVVNKIDVRASAGALSLKDPSMRNVDYGLKVGRAELVNATALNTFLPSSNIVTIESGHALIAADLATSGLLHQAGGRIDVSLANGGIRLHETHLAGDFALLIAAHRFDPDRALVDLEGSLLTMRKVCVSGSFDDTSAWGGDLTLESGTLALASTPRLEGDLGLKARDASPILGVLFRDSLPKFVAQLTAMPSFTALAHIAIEPENLAVSDLFASGGDIALRGTYVTRGADHDAAFVVQKGPWSVGVSLDNAGTHLRLFGLDRWYGERVQHALAPR